MAPVLADIEVPSAVGAWNVPMTLSHSYTPYEGPDFSQLEQPEVRIFVKEVAGKPLQFLLVW